MKLVLDFLYNFVLIFLVILLIYLVFVNKRKKNYSKLKKNDYVRLFIARYNLDIKKTKYKTILNVVGVINSFILSFTAVLSMYIESFIWKILVIFVVVFSLIYALYELAGRILKRKEEKKNV